MHSIIPWCYVWRHVIHVPAYAYIYIHISVPALAADCRSLQLLCAKKLMHICQHITISNVRHCICIMHETRIAISCISCIPVPVTCRSDTLILVVVVVICIPAATSHQMQSAILIASSSWWDRTSWTPPTHGLWVLSPHPLGPSAPQPLILALTTRLRCIANLERALAMRNGDVARLWGLYGVWASLDTVLSLSLEMIKKMRLVNMHGL